MPQLPTDSSQIDSKVVKVMSAIKKIESNNNYGAVGDLDRGVSRGAYQFNRNNFQNWAAEHGLDPTDFSPANQNKVAYARIKKFKDQGYQPEEIAALWNGAKKDASGRMTYINPQYGEKFRAALQEVVRGGRVASAATGFNPTPYTQSAGGQMKPSMGLPEPEVKKDKSFLEDLGATATGVGQGLSEAAAQGQTNPLSGLLQGAGAVFGGVGDAASNVIEHLPVVGGIVKGAEELVGKAAQPLVESELGQQAIGAYQSLPEEWRKNIGAVGNIATAIPVIKGVSMAKGAVKGAVKRTLTGGVDEIAEMVGPKLTPKETARAISERGTENKGILRKTVLKADPKVTELSNTISKYVPKFNPGKGLLYNIKETQDVVSQMARNLKREVIAAGEGRIFPIKELESMLKNIEKPLLISSDATLNNAYKKVITKVVDIVRGKGGKVSSLLDARQEFDAFVKKQFPNLYRSDTLTPMRQAIKDIRNSLNEFTAENLPPGVGLRDKLFTQHQLINALENMTEKAASSAGSELGTNVFTRMAGRHPYIRGAVKTGIRAAVEGAGIGGVMRIMD